MNLNFIESSPVPAKAFMSIMGLCSEYVRQPLCSITQSNKKLLALAIKKAGLI